MITLGDEFQGLLTVGSSAIIIVDRIEREMYPLGYVLHWCWRNNY